MSIISATGEYVYTLESGLIYRHKRNAPEQRSEYAKPTGVVSKIMATDRHLYALLSDGSVSRRWHDGDSWSAYTAPAGTTHLSSSDHQVFALSATGVYRRHDAQDEAFSLQIELSSLADVVQLDHDEAYAYALTSTGLIYFGKDYQGWTLFPVPLSDVVEIAAGINFVYARVSSGSVYRSKHYGYSGWALMGAYDDVLGMAIETTHADRLWLCRAAGIAFQRAADWVKPTGKIRGWCVSDWCTEDWVEVA